MHITQEYVGSTGDVLGAFPGGRLLVGEWWVSDQEVRGRRKADLGEGPGNSLQYSCLENPWTEELGGLQSMGLLNNSNNNTLA